MKVIIAALLALFSINGKTASLIVTKGELTSVTIQIDAQIDGLIKRFQLDTGSGFTIIAPDNQTLKYPVVGKNTIGGIAGIKNECDLVSLPSMTIDETILLNYQVTRCDLGNSSLNNLGLDFFNDHIISLDFQNNQLFLLKTSLEKSVFYPLIRLDHGHLKIQAKIAGVDSNIIFDTGAQITAVDSHFVNTHSEFFKFIGDIDNGKDITGTPVIMKMYEMNQIEVGSLFLDKIGTNAITQANWIMDLKTNRWSVSPFIQ